VIMQRSALICIASRAGRTSETARGSRREATPRTGAQGRPLPRRGRGGSPASRCKVAPTSSPASTYLPGQSAHPCTNSSANTRDSAIPRGPRRAASWPLQIAPPSPWVSGRNGTENTNKRERVGAVYRPSLVRSGCHSPLAIGSWSAKV
jgi:hypothetical protein